MQMIGRLKARPAGRLSLLTLGLFSLCFLVGLYGGRFFAEKHSAVVVPELSRYLGSYFELTMQTALTAQQLIRSLWLYFRYPLLVFLLVFASFGVVLIPVLGVAMTFSFSYSVSCFVATIGAKGAMLALVLLGLRYLLTLPCFLLLGEQSLRTSWELTRCTLGQGKRYSAALYDRAYFLKFLMASAVLTAGAVLDLWLMPWLLQLAA